VELGIICLVTLICFPVITLTEGILRIVLGVIFLLIFPGYTMLAALFPNKNSITGIERAGLTPVLSFALVSLAGLVLNYTPWGVQLIPVYTVMAILIILTSGIAFLRRKSLPKDERFKLKMNFRFLLLRDTSKLEKVFSIGMAIALVVAVYLLVRLVTQPVTGQAFTEFYVVSPKTVLENNPHVLRIGDKLDITLAINNHENVSTSYNLMVVLDGEQSQSIGPIMLTDEEIWTEQITISPNRIGENQEVQLQLFKDEEPEKYLALKLWLDVID
jgi:uncharacterized membrane protein